MDTNNGMESDELQEIQKAFEMLNSSKEIEIEYRLHYDSAGFIYMTTHLPTDHPENTQYIIVDSIIYEQAHKYKIVDGKPVEIKHDAGLRPAFIRNQKGYSVVAGQAALLLENDEEIDNTETYGRRNS